MIILWLGVKEHIGSLEVPLAGFDFDFFLFFYFFG